MSKVKYSGIKIGTGNFANKNGECEFFVGTLWSNTSTYTNESYVIYNSIVYLSIQSSNVGNQPDISPSYWASSQMKDGDIFIQTPAAGYPSGGSDVGILQQINGILVNNSTTPTVVALTDGQASPVDALTYPAGILTSATIEYTIKRGSGQGRRRKGTLNILNDSVSSSNYSNEFVEIGNDVNVPLTVSVSGGLVHIQYTSTNEGVAIQLSYTIKGWAS